MTFTSFVCSKLQPYNSMNPCCLSGKHFGSDDLPVRHFVRSADGRVFPIHHNAYMLLRDLSPQLKLYDEDAVVIISSASPDEIDMIVSARFIRGRWSDSTAFTLYLGDCQAAAMEQECVDRRIFIEGVAARAWFHCREVGGPWSNISE